MNEKDKQKEKKKEVALCIPVYGTITADWFVHYSKFMAANVKKYIIHVNIQTGQPTDKNRNKLIEAALLKNPDYIMFMDSDNLVPVNALETMVNNIEQEKVDFVTALYFEKAPPYYPVLRKFRSNGFWKVDNLPLGQLIQIDGAGMGCCLMKPDIFQKKDWPWFKFSWEKWGTRGIQLSEDLYFCRMLRQQKKKMIVNTGIVVSHIGGIIDAPEYFNFMQIREELKNDREECAQDLMEFQNLSRQDLDFKTMVGKELMTKEWEAKNPKTNEEIKKFYKETENYLYDLFEWHFGTRRQYDVEIHTVMTDQLKPKNILDYGCGIGQNAMMMARSGISVTLADLNSKTLNFAKHRFEKHNVPHKIWTLDEDETAPDPMYDAIFIFDVLEHLPLDELKTTVEKLIKLKHKDTKIYLTNNFGKTVDYPMHFDTSMEHVKLIERLVKECGGQANAVEVQQGSTDADKTT